MQYVPVLFHCSIRLHYVVVVSVAHACTYCTYKSVVYTHTHFVHKQGHNNLFDENMTGQVNVIWFSLPGCLRRQMQQWLQAELVIWHMTPTDMTRRSAQCGHLKSTGKTSETESNEQKTNTYMEKMGVKERREHFFVAVKQEVWYYTTPLKGSRKNQHFSLQLFLVFTSWLIFLLEIPGKFHLNLWTIKTRQYLTHFLHFPSLSLLLLVNFN